MSFFPQIATGGPGKGLWPGEIIVRCTFTEAATARDHVILDLMDVAANAAIAPGDDTQFSTVRDPDTGTAPDVGLEHAIFGVALDTVAAGGEGDVMFYGITQCNVDAATTAGDALMGAVNGQLDVITGSSGNKVIAIALDTDTSNVSTCWFNGFGWGQDG